VTRPALALAQRDFDSTARGLRLEAIDAFKQKCGIETIVPFIANDFDDPLPEDFLLLPLSARA
jgi:hypothetical protein